jgi:hypothetical protein
MLIAFPRQQWLRERASMLRYMYIACLVTPELSFTALLRRCFPGVLFLSFANFVFNFILSSLEQSLRDSLVQFTGHCNTRNPHKLCT